MQFKHEIDQDKKNVTVNMSGLMNGDEFIVFYEELMTKIEGKGIASILWDTRNLDMRKVTADHIEKVLMYVNKWSSIRKGGQSVWVVNNVFKYGIARMIENIIEVKNLFDQDYHFKIFKDYTKAQEWIGG